jgi:hypothetical protein
VNREHCSEFARHAALAALRPLMPLSALTEVVGSQCDIPDANGYIFQLSDDHGFFARIDLDDRIGQLGFSKKFPEDIRIENLHIGMVLDAALASRGSLTFIQTNEYGISEYNDKTDAGDQLNARFKDGRLIGFDLESAGLAYVRPLPKKYKLLTERHDLSLLPATIQQRASSSKWFNGWAFGLPPGISTAQWPLSRNNGFPLRHAFTLHVPEQYRVRGADLVALCIFADDQFELLETVPEIQEFMNSEALAADGPPEDPRLLPFWENHKKRHPHQYDMEDDLETQFAGIWLTQAEFDGSLCLPPDLSTNPLLRQKPRPGWLAGKMAEYYSSHNDRICITDAEGNDVNWPDLECLKAASAIAVNRSTDDLNVGKPAREWDHENEISGYVTPFSPRGEELQLSRFQYRNHLGGTMFPSQGYPDFSPFYIEFEEYFGGFNFGGGNCQIDFEKMELDWSC